MTPERAMVLANQAMREAESIGPRKAIMQAILSAVAEERERCAKCRDAVPILPGQMPDEMWAVLSTDRDAATEALRIVVRQTLDEYEQAIRAEGE